MEPNDERYWVLQEFWEKTWADIRAAGPETVRNDPVAARILDAGADMRDVLTLITSERYGATFGVLFNLTCEEDIEELAAMGVLNGLHESLLSYDPTGQEGADFIQ